MDQPKELEFKGIISVILPLFAKEDLGPQEKDINFTSSFEW